MSDLGRAAQAIGKVTETITGVSGQTNLLALSATIATAVEEPSVSTQEIAANISQVSSGIGQVNENVTQSAHVAGDTTRDITEVNQANDLRTIISIMIRLIAAYPAEVASTA